MTGRSCEVVSLQWDCQEEDGEMRSGMSKWLWAVSVLLVLWAVGGCRLIPEAMFVLDKEDMALQSSAASGAAPSFVCPLATKPPVLDGVLDEWDAHPAPIQVTAKDVAFQLDGAEGDEDISGTIWLAWDQDHLYVAARVVDDILRGTEKDTSWWFGDHIEVYVDVQYKPGVYGEFGQGQYQIGLLPSPPYAEPAEAAGGLPQDLDASSVMVASVQTENGYACEASIPWELLGVKPERGMVLGVDVSLSDTDQYANQDSMTSLVPGPWACGRREHLVSLKLSGTRR